MLMDDEERCNIVDVRLMLECLSDELLRRSVFYPLIVEKKLYL